ncbi:ScbR family autoregulator-binding transcription factor [Saccharopolyspora thermophila]|uniref:Transcriptional regulator CprB n=1 Tax=Saccharopolyspora thermophila TaxID=89367 RepID=A0ABN1BUI4_9PSEU
MPQQRRAKITRRTILAAAAEEFDAVGYEATTLSTVLRRSGITKGAFYFHFSSKEAVAEALVRQYEQARDEMWRRWTGRGLDPLSTAVGLTREAARRLEHDVTLRAGLLLACRHICTDVGDGWEEMLDELLRRSAEQGQLRSGVDPGEAARVLFSALVGTHTIGMNAAGMPERVEAVWRVVLGGVAREDWLLVSG